MASQKIPYPPPPTDVPEGLTDFEASYTKQQNLLLAGLFTFLILYMGAIVLFAMLAVWCALTYADLFPVKVAGFVVSFIFFLFLVKGFFKTQSVPSRDTLTEITEDEQPLLFGFIHRLCDELDAPYPDKVFVSADVNAACITRTSLINLFVYPKRDLLIGLGLVNCTNLSEFKAIMAHEFGHFCQLGRSKSYTMIVHNIIADMVFGEDWFDRLIAWIKRSALNLAQQGGRGKSAEQKRTLGYAAVALIYPISWSLDVGKAILYWVLKTITLQDRAVSQEREFHADLVAVSAAGSDASAHGLLRARFGMQCFNQAVGDLITAMDHKLYTTDLYLHQDRAGIIVRRKQKDYTYGMPPELPTPMSGAKTKVFDPDLEEIEDDDDTPPMWRTHPSDADREENVKERFVPAVMDHRSPWLLFTDAAELRERLTYKFYRKHLNVPKSVELTDAQKVQEYIDNEHGETTYDPKYFGAYDERIIEPGDLAELNDTVERKPWDEERLEKVYEKLYDGCRQHAEAHTDLHKELYSLRARSVGRPKGKLKQKIKDVEDGLDENREWFKSFDKRVYLLHVQLAALVNPALRTELIERYRFQLEVQRLYQESRFHYNEADSHLKALYNADPNELSADFVSEVLSVLRQAWKSLKNIVKDARDINLPAMKNFEEGENLGDFILQDKLVPEPPLSGVKGVWIDKLMTQLNRARNRCFRLHFKSLGGILAVQEKIAAQWIANRTPVGEGVESFVAGADDDVVEAEVLPDRIYTSVAEIRVESLTRGHPPEVEVLEVEVVDDGRVPGEIRVESVGSPGAFSTASASAFAPVPPEPLPVDDVIDAAVVEVVEDDVPVVVVPDEPASPFSFTPTPAAVPKPAPASASKPAPKPDPEAAPLIDTPFSLDFDAEPVPTPAPRPTPKPEPAPAAPTVAAFTGGSSVVATPKPATKLPEDSVAQTFALDAAVATTAADEIFSLDADDIAARAAPKPAPTPKAKAEPTPVAEEEVFELGGDDVVDDEPVQAATESKGLSGATAAPPARAAFGSKAVAPAVETTATNGTGRVVVKPAEGKRPALRITFVKPGEKSPFGK